MPSFPFFRLPVLIQYLVLKNLGILELIDFSLLSKRSKQVAKSLNVTLACFEWDFLYLYVPKLVLINRNGEQFSLRVSSSQVNSNGGYQPGYLTMNGVTRPVCREYREPSPTLYVTQLGSRTERLDMLEQFTKHLLELFRVDKFNARILLSYFPKVQECFVWKYTTHFETLKFDEFVRQQQHLLTNAELIFILEELTTDCLNLDVGISPGVMYPKALKMSSLETLESHWLPLESILNTDCSRIRIYDSFYGYNDLNTIIKKWMDGGLENLVEFSVEISEYIEEESRESTLNRVLDGIDTFPWNATNRPPGDFKDGRDIRRSDGRLATVDQLPEDTSGFVFLAFYVWPLEETYGI